MDIVIDWTKMDNPDKYPEYRTYEICLAAVKYDGYELENIEVQTPELCLAALESSWNEVVYEMIDIPIEGEFLKEINKMKLLKGPFKNTRW